MRGVRGRSAQCRGDQGFSLVAVMMALLVISGLALVAVSVAAGQVTSSAQGRDREAALHAAEAGAERVLATLLTAPTYATSSSSPCPAAGSGQWHCLPAGLTDTQQRAWALQQFRQAEAAAPTDPASAAIAVPGGLALGIRPVSAGTTAPLPMVFGVAEVGGGSKQLRVVRLTLNDQGPRVTHGVVATRDLLVDNNATVGGTTGSAHSNADLYVGATGGAIFQAPGTGTATGSVRPCTSASSCAPGPGSGALALDLPGLRAADLYPRQPPAAGSWFDLCPDGAAHAWSAAGPCDPSTIRPTPGAPAFTYNPGNQAWEIKDQLLTTTTYYVHHGSALLTQIGGQVSVLASRDPTINDPGQGNVLVTNANVSNPSVTPALPGIGIIADRDLRLDSTVTVGQPATPALLVAGEQLEIYNNSTLYGAALALDNTHRPTEPPHATGSPVPANRIDSNSRVTYDGNLRYPLDQVPRVRAWKEPR